MQPEFYLSPEFNCTVSVDYELTFLICSLELSIRYPHGIRFVYLTDFFVGKCSSLLVLVISKMQINEVDNETSCYYGSCKDFH